MEANDNILHLIEAWLRGELGAEQTAELERLMAEDAKFADEVNSYKEAFDILDETSWRLSDFNPKLEIAQDYLGFYTDEKNKAYLNELKAISDGRQTRRKANVRSILGAIGVAAMIVLAIVFIRDGGNPVDYDSLYAEYAYADEIPTFTVRGDNDLILSQIETQFDAKNFKEVNTIISNNEDDFDEEQKSLVSIYQGIAFGERGMYKEASDVLNNEDLFENSIYGQMSEWYLALILLKNEPVKKRATEMLKKIAEDDIHYKQAEAKQILSRL